MLLAVFLLGTIMLSFPAAAAKTSGTCGDALNWSFDKATGTLTVSGHGEMKNDAYDYPKWGDLKKEITRVVIGEGCTSVSFSAFSSCRNLTSVVLPKSLTHIAQSAFDGCWALKDISLTHVTSIGNYAFNNCSSLTVLTVPKGVSQINSGAFSNCQKLQTVNFHNGITEIGSYAFSDCTALTSVTIPDSVTTVGGNAFSRCTNLTEVHLGAGVTELGGNAFQNCPKLKSIRIPDKVAEIKINTFTGCTALETVEIGAKVSKINPDAFNGCTSLKAFTLCGHNPNLTVDKGVLYSQDNAELLLMPKQFTGHYTVLPGTKAIGVYSCQETGLESITIPGSVTVIASYAFADCKSLKSVNLSEGLLQVKNHAFTRTAVTKITFPESVTGIDSFAFSGCVDLKEIRFLGAPPKFGFSVFNDVIAPVYYPGGISQWENVNCSNISGKLTWTPLVCQTHTVITLPAKETTCTQNGCTEGRYCSVCKQVFAVQQTLAAPGHTFGAWVTNGSTDIADWFATRTCSTCGYEDIHKANLPPASNPENTQSDTPQTPSQPAQAPSQPAQAPSDAPAQLPTQSAPEPTENSTAGTESSAPAATDPAATEPDTSGVKWGVIVVIAGALLLGLGTSGFLLAKPKLPSDKK